ncbi:DNA (cytosine-5)-methyltransferase 1 [Thermocatellispora tengchongensis]|uniref:DNA (Cytosine-5)-methyltransferase 1 n=1 Tax=Thermocatellispora tengchongensis TaxID=1073253 RepID=A0A840PS87_9ACTN|nr:DNA cytosine methyltransferase [Thermocatellispora tengchongensis]MBB5139987.1 DNA (cytosine-5)-methyltransferase 1 [Thermocatellispora tengchongensis]
MKPRVLDAFCGVGGATRGYQLAGFYVVGVDIRPQRRYCGDEFVRGDAVRFIRAHGHEFDFIHTSPPCQAHSTLTLGTNQGRTYQELIPVTRRELQRTGRPWVIENVPTAPIRRDLMLCGVMFPELAVLRHRWFEFGGIRVEQPAHPQHRGRVAGYRHGEWFEGPYVGVYGKGGGKGPVSLWQQAMGIDWTSARREIRQAIPPAYTELIGRAVHAQLPAAGFTPTPNPQEVKPEWR